MTLRQLTPRETRWAIESQILISLKFYHAKKHLVAKRGLSAIKMDDRPTYWQGLAFHKRGFTCH